jgi:cell division protein FtsQ
LSARRLRQLASAVALLGVGAVAIWGGLRVLDRPIRTITISGDFERVSPVQIEAALGDLRGVGFLSADLDELQHRIEGLAWVEQAGVQRRWPGELRLTVVEQVPAARWREAGLLNTRGELFLESARHIPAELPSLAGPPGSEGRVARRYLDMRGPLAEAGHLLAAVQLDERGAWRIRLGSGLEVRFGRQQFEQRFGRLLRLVAPLLAARDGAARYVDLRYSRGFTVAWVAADQEQQQRQEGTETDV